MVSLLTWLRILPPKMRHTHLILRPLTPDHNWQTLRCLPPGLAPMTSLLTWLRSLPPKMWHTEVTLRLPNPRQFQQTSAAQLQVSRPHLAAQLSPENAAHKGGGRKVRVGLGLEGLQAGLVHGIQQAAQELMRVLLTAQTEPVGAASKG